MFRQKQVSLEEWRQFEEIFARQFIQVFKSDPRYALFLESSANAEPFTLLIPEYNSCMIEVFSPGGWQDCVNPMDRTWKLLVGNADAQEAFGLPGPIS